MRFGGAGRKGSDWRGEAAGEEGVVESVRRLLPSRHGVSWKMAGQTSGRDGLNWTTGKSVISVKITIWTEANACDLGDRQAMRYPI